MSQNIPNLFTEQFTANLQMRLQQQGSKLRGKVMEGFHVGKAASPVNYIGAIQSRAPAGRFAPMNRVDADFQRRWVFPQEREIPQLVDTFDLLQTIVDPKSQYTMNASNACGRDWDDALISAAFGSAVIGTDPQTFATESFDPNSQSLTVASTFDDGSTHVGITVKKLIEIRRLFRHLHVDLESDPLCLVAGSQQEADLLSQVQVVSTEYRNTAVLEDGKVTRFMGFDIVYSERLASVTVDTSFTVRNVIAMAKSGIYLGMWKDMTNDVDIRKDLSGLPYQLYTMHMFGATRLEPGRLIKVQCLDTTGADPTIFS